MYDTSGVWTIGLGAPNQQTVMKEDGWPSSIIALIIIANSPQVIFSTLCFAFNNLVSAITLAHEWSQYAVKRKGLRVSISPQGAQRSSYFLSLPYRYAVPMMTASAVLLWLISQSLFLVTVVAYDVNQERDYHHDLTTCGYSPVAILSGVVVGGLMLLSLIGLGFRRFESGMPVASSCSLAISAACHPGVMDAGMSESESSDSDTPHLPLKWGVMSSDGEGGHSGVAA
ncbi:hypothetical protein VTN00DRAFT_4314 [Thermoascus crustaceus]|uniref:uncharacterized protein n=1 Tax=Thermoascus crustaceus TaxID=5088 RepID=UPI00374349D1